MSNQTYRVTVRYSGSPETRDSIERAISMIKFVDAVEVPVLANITEFGSTPLFTTDELADAGVSIALYPLSAFRAANAAALRVYEALRTEGTQQSVMDSMQTRSDLYHYLGYHEFEEKLDALFASEAD